jgi:hypothetical protein
MAAVMGGFIEQKGKILDALAVSPTDPLVAIVEFEGRGPWALIPPTPTRNVSRPGRASQSSVSCPPISRTWQTGVWQNAILTVQWASSLENKRPCFATQVGNFPVA